MEAALREARTADIADIGGFVRMHNTLSRHWNTLSREPQYMFRAHKRMSHSLGWMLFTWICFVASASCGLAATIPQLVRSLRTRDTDSISLIFVVLLISTFFFRILYAVLYREVGNIVLVLLAVQYIILLGLKVQYSYVDPPTEPRHRRW